MCHVICHHPYCAVLPNKFEIYQTGLNGSLVHRCIVRLENDEWSEECSRYAVMYLIQAVEPATSHFRTFTSLENSITGRQHC